MKKTIKFLTALFSCASLLMSVPALAEYRTFDDGNITYGIFQAKPEEVQLHWKDAEGNDYQSLTRLKNALEDSYNVKMIMNAGIYSMNNVPAGLWIEQGKELNALNTKSGKGNFHVQPNGVFAIAGNKPYILTTAAYQKSKLKPDFALQSGPMLIIHGKMNSQFRASLESYHKRNAVCLTKQNELLFLMTIKGEPNLYTLSQGLLKIGCHDALYLDGTISNWYISGQFNTLHWKRFVGMISVLDVNKK